MKKKDELIALSLQNDQKRIEKLYSPDQERDEHGRWSSGGGGSEGPSNVPQSIRDKNGRDNEKWANHIENGKDISHVPTDHLYALHHFNMGWSGGHDHPDMPKIEKELANRGMTKPTYEHTSKVVRRMGLD